MTPLFRVIFAQLKKIIHKKSIIKDWIANHREKFEDNVQKEIAKIEGREKTDCTFHGLRHRYARDRYNEEIQKGLTERQARIQVSHKLGHGRDEVTKVYL